MHLLLNLLKLDIVIRPPQAGPREKNTWTPASFHTYEDIIIMTLFSPFDYTAVAVSGKVKRSKTGFTTQVEWLFLLKLTVLSRSSTVV